MPLRKEVKPDAGVWLPLMAEYRLTSLAHDTLLEGTLRSDLTPVSKEVREALSAWSGPVHFQSSEPGLEVALVYPTEDERGRGPWLHIVLFLATLFTTMAAGALMQGRDPFATELFQLGRFFFPYPSGLDWSLLAVGAPFAFPFMGVLLAHEMGHYVAARVHRVRATLPYFIPCPPYLSIIGTIGAFIRLKGPTVRRSVLFDIGAAGPLASFLISLPLLAVGLSLSQVVVGRAVDATPFVLRFAGQSVWLGSGLLTQLLAAWFGPGPLGEAPILLHPLAVVGWLGLFVTALNLLPLGQLDGGHVLYALSPRHQVNGARGVFVGLLLFGMLWWGWWVWAAIIGVLHRGRMGHPRVVQPRVSLDGRRTVLAWILIFIFFVTFVPVPLNI